MTRPARVAVLALTLLALWGWAVHRNAPRPLTPVPARQAFWEGFRDGLLGPYARLAP
jgi:hypothetical protein